MPLTARDILMNADLFRAAYPRWPSTVTRDSGSKLSTLRTELDRDGWTATSPDKLGDDDKRTILEDRWAEQ